MENTTDPKLLNLIIAVMGYIGAQEEPKNPFVRGLGQSKNDEQAYEYLVTAMNDCREYFPEVEEMIQSLLISETE